MKKLMVFLLCTNIFATTYCQSINIKGNIEKSGGAVFYNSSENANALGYNNQQISDIDFNALKQSLLIEPFDSKKMAISKQAALQNYFNAAEVKEILVALTFDDNKLDVAKYFYSRTIDKQNYHQLTDALIFSDNKNALLAFIKR